MTVKRMTTLAAAALALSAWCGEAKYPKEQGPADGPRILLVNGGRPWTAHDFASPIILAGARVTCLSGEYLDGFSDASIKPHMSDKTEPAAFDGLAEAFRRLPEYDLVLVHCLPVKNQNALFTPERVRALKAYVENGGHLAFSLSATANFGDFGPLALGGFVNRSEEMYAERPAGARFAMFAEKIPVFDRYRTGRPTEGAEVLSWICDASGKRLAPFIAKVRRGKGSVLFFNYQVLNPRHFREFYNWAWARPFSVATVAEAMDRDLDAEKGIQRLDPIPERAPVKEARASALPPTLWVQENEEQPAIKGRTATFTNGLRIEVLEDGAVSATWPKGGNVIRRFEIPSVKLAKKATMAYDAKTAEMTEVEDFGEQTKFEWRFVSLEANGYRAVVRYEADVRPDGEGAAVTQTAVMKWAFKGGVLHLDGRDYPGFADAVAVVKCPGLLGGVDFRAELTPEDPKFARRFSCYSPPRGYSDFDMSGATTADTSNWSLFGSGQPFELLVCGKGVYAGTPTGAEPLSVRMQRKQGADAIVNTRWSGFGRVKAPRATEFWWHWYSEGPERAHNEYLALYQLVRKKLRQRYGLKELPGYPVAEYGYQLTEKEKAAVTKYAVEQGYRFVMPPSPETPIESVNSPGRMDEYRRIKAAGADVRIWTAGSYTQGMENRMVGEHPEWFARDEKGKIMQYGNSYPVYDIFNDGFRSWFTNIMTDAKNAGVRWVYRDMDGAAAGVVDYAKPESQPGIKRQIWYYRFFHNNGMYVGVEGMNPLVLDEYWYRKEKYTSFAGKEFCMVGEIPGCLLSAGLSLDAFRTGMYACFPRFEHAGAAFGFDRLPDEVKRARRADSFTRKFNEALDICGMPFVRETPFGTVWTGERGGAVFFWNPTEKATIDLPKGWRIRGVDGNVIRGAKGDDIYFIDKEG